MTETYIIKQNNLSQERLKELLSYDQSTGLFTWLSRTSNRVSVGDIAGSAGKLGYVYIRLDGVRYLAHRLAWFYVTGEWPSNNVDHIDGNPSNNRLGNLRNVTQSGNLQNQRRAHSGSTSGVLGVYPSRKRFTASIKAEGKKKHLGQFDTKEQAHAAYVNAKRVFHEAGTL